MIAEAVAAPMPVTQMPPVAPKAPPKPKITVEQYLEMERKSAVRHEYVDGVVIEMAGESPAHNRIARNIVLGLENRFGDQPCETFIEGIRVWVTPTQYRYPDVVALCGEAQFDTTNPPALLNPGVIFKVLSPFTGGQCRHGQWTEYQQLTTVTDYVLVAQDVVQVMHYVRVSDAQWTITIYRDRQDTLPLAALNTSLPLADIYRKIVFPTPGTLAAATAQGL